MKKSSVLILLFHIGYWFPRLTPLYIMFRTDRSIDYNAYYYQLIGSDILSIVTFYIFYFYLFPRFLQRRQISNFTIYSVGIIAISCILSYPLVRFIHHYFYENYYHANNFKPTVKALELYAIFLNIVYAAIYACIIRGFITWFTEIRYKEQLERKNIETSHALLKAQINPHFLFNTLNNIDILIEKDPTIASTYLKKLSDILRFTLYESPSETIPLQQEADYISQYIELQKIRTNNPDFVSFEVKGDIGNVFIAPMLFIPFIENAFKHSTNKKISNAITININTHQGVINFSCVNAYDDDAIATQEKSGLGLELIRSRLQLLYPDNYTLAIDKNAWSYSVNLSINIV